MTFGEDRSRICTGHGLAIMASLRNFAIPLARSRGFPNIAKALRAFAYHPHRALAATSAVLAPGLVPRYLASFSQPAAAGFLRISGTFQHAQSLLRRA